MNRKNAYITKELKPKSHIDDFLLEKLSLIVSPLAKTFGTRCEVVLHDLRQLDRSIIKIEHGHVTGRSVGGSIIDGRAGDKGLKLLKGETPKDTFVNYESKSMYGKTLKSTTILIKNQKRETIGALCINIDIEDLLSSSLILNDFCKTEDDNKNAKSLEEDIIETVKKMIHNEIEHYPCSVSAMKKSDRVNIVSKLYAQGVFAAKGAVKIVANKLNVSKYAIYNYLEDID
jgi:predicted transcriptional regulator YheO